MGGFNRTLLCFLPTGDRLMVVEHLILPWLCGLEFLFFGLIQGDEESSKVWFLNHDATHVIFGTIPFDLKGEVFNDIWTIFGSLVTLKEYSDFFKFTIADKVFSLYDGVIKVFFAFLALIPGCIRVFF
jgi:hypothetical protein